MRPEERDQLVHYRLERAHEALTEASLLMEQELWRGSVNRLYYAMFYGVVALLATRDIFPKTHKGVRQQFSMLFLATGKIPDHLGLAYSELYERRHSGDYDDFVNVEGEVVMRLQDHTVVMIGTIADIIADKEGTP
jgi:uncharacterized protein (UPF0332 family)